MNTRDRAVIIVFGVDRNWSVESSVDAWPLMTEIKGAHVRTSLGNARVVPGFCVVIDQASFC